jgi:putative transposase
MSKSIRIDDIEAIRATPRPDEASVRQEDRDKYRARVAALDSVLDGTTVQDACRRWGVPRNTMDRVLHSARSFDEAHNRIGYRACVPHMRFCRSGPNEVIVPESAHAFAFDAVLSAVPNLQKLVDGYRGSLPTKTKRSPPFNRLHGQVVRVLDQLGYSTMYPLNTSDRGRRRLIEYIKRLRGARGAEEAADVPEDPSATRIEHLFPIRPFDRVEYDEHAIDIDAWVAMPMADGTYRFEKISRMWLLVVIDVGSGAILGWRLVMGRKYDRYEVLALFAEVMQPHVPRELSQSEIQYSPNAWVPSMYLTDNTVMRSIMVAMDNDSSHLAKQTVDNLMDHHMGILHFGRSGMGEGRPYIEAFFKRIEDGLFRYVAGGYSPATAVNEKQITSYLDGKSHPILLEVFGDLVDTYVTAHNVTSRSTREPRSPKRLIDEHLAAGAWVWHPPTADRQVRQMTVVRMRVTVRGSQKNGVPPTVYLDHARYRSPKLSGQWSLIGTSFDATYEDWQDVRKLTLWKGGERVVTLHAMAPYAACAHTLSVRLRAARWAKHPAAREQEDFDIKDNVQAYHAAVRNAADGIQDAGSMLSSGQVASAPATSKVEIQSPLKGARQGITNMRLR